MTHHPKVPKLTFEPLLIDTWRMAIELTTGALIVVIRTRIDAAKSRKTPKLERRQIRYNDSVQDLLGRGREASSGVELSGSYLIELTHGSVQFYPLWK